MPADDLIQLYVTGIPDEMSDVSNNCSGFEWLKKSQERPKNCWPPSSNILFFLSFLFVEVRLV